MRFFGWVLSLLISLSTITYAEQPLTSKRNVQHFISYMVKTHHFNRQELNSLFSQVKLQPAIIESMERPYEKKNWDVYKQLFITPQRIEGGIAFWQANQANLARAEKQYGVPAHIIVAILGVETLYGKNQGSYRVIDALSTLSFNYPKRAPFFTKELEQFLLLCKEHHVSPLLYLGSYAGAMGKPQFMPSSYRFYAMNFSGDAKKDLMNDNSAVIASVANYFSKHGWKYQQEVAMPVRVEGFNNALIDTSCRSAIYTLGQLNKAGVKSPSTVASGSKVGLIELTTETGPEFWLTYPNFYVITRYNTSPQYALAVYLLSQSLKEQYTKMKNATVNTL